MDGPSDDVVIRTAEGVLEGGPGARTRCQNCDQTLHGPFCAHCGQRDGELHLSLAYFLREALDGFLSFDSRAWRTIAVLIGRPGFLTVEYWQGRRVRYLPPLRLYLLISFAAFLVQGLAGANVVFSFDDGSSNAPIRVTAGEGGEGIDWERDFVDNGPAVQWLAQNLLRPAVEEPERLGALLLDRLPWATFLLVPFFGAMLRLLYRRVDPFFVPHLIFALHVHSAYFLLTTLAQVGALATGATWLVALGGFGSLVILWFSLGRVYGGGWPARVAKMTGMLVVYGVANLIMLTLLFVLTSLAM